MRVKNVRIDASEEDDLSAEGTEPHQPPMRSDL